VNIGRTIEGALLGAAAILALCGADDGQPASEARKVMQNFAKCLVNRSGYRLHKALDIPVGDPKGVDTLSALSDSECLADSEKSSASGSSVELRFKPSLLRGSLYEIFFAQEFAAKPALTNFDGVGPVNYPLVTTATSDEAIRYRIAISIGECAVRAQPVLARQLVLSDVESTGESAAIKAIVPFLGPCVPAGQTFKISKSVVRSLIAEPLYRLTKAYAESPHA